MPNLSVYTLVLGMIVGLATGYSLAQHQQRLKFSRDRRRKGQHGNDQVLTSQSQNMVVNGVVGLIGHTPLVRLPSLSEATGCEIYAKAEFLNPGGSPKDRVALAMVEAAEQAGKLVPHTQSCLFEGTVGSTGVSLAMIARAKGYQCHIVMPDDQAQEKYALLERLQATVEKVRPVSIVNPLHFVNVARRRAQVYGRDHSGRQGLFADQFENLANFRAHYNHTGPEIYAQTQGVIHAFVAGAGTGGTLAGITRYLKTCVPHLRAVVADPQGSGLFHRVKNQVMYTPEEAEGSRRRHQVDTVVEGIGMNRITRNVAQVLGGNGAADDWVDDAVRVTDQEAVWMARYLVNKEGLFVGSSSAVNCVAAVRTALALGPGHTVVTVLNDSGQRHLTKFWNDSHLSDLGLSTTVPDTLEFLTFSNPPDL